MRSAVWRGLRPGARAAAGGRPRVAVPWTGKSLTKATACRVSRSPRWRMRRCPTRTCRAGKRPGGLTPFLDLSRSVWRTRAYGDFWSHMLVAEGAVDISAEPEVSLWDLAALQVVVQEAGGSLHRPGRQRPARWRQRLVQQRRAPRRGTRTAGGPFGEPAAPASQSSSGQAA